jgi:hypothetical protein
VIVESLIVLYAISSSNRVKVKPYVEFKDSDGGCTMTPLFCPRWLGALSDDVLLSLLSLFLSLYGIS